MEEFDRSLAAFPDAERRQMFGCPCAFVNGNMVTGLHEDKWLVRLTQRDREDLLGSGGGIFNPMGPTMREYASLPREMVAEISGRMEWLEKAFGYVRSLPPKKKSERKPRRRKSK